MRLAIDFDNLMFSFEGTRYPLSGGHSKEVPPVPIPNTEVKLLSVEDTWRATARENRTLPEQINGRSEYASSVMYILTKTKYTIK